MVKRDAEEGTDHRYYPNGLPCIWSANAEAVCVCEEPENRPDSGNLRAGILKSRQFLVARGSRRMESRCDVVQEATDALLQERGLGGAEVK
ncbi:hypothetical protein PRIPAC_84618 [Pristionchus pacificus]|uniref:Uncharacterized protein n=1 Tax=Pristionchus pacificus TaxID=54126 RepID=A0A2A6CEB5_PRIPA|nr:hypothetical protein PRIPAC_84618 [Pristionchus pacificus]|eukprot:PDM76585.1 hypothetical protein PRIPAC_42951 [Pristionchus pacificus]